MNRQMRRLAAKSKPPRQGTGHIELPVTLRHGIDEELDLMLVPQLSADHMRDVIATEPDWHTVVMRLNWGRVLNSENFENGGEVIARAQDVMVLIKDSLNLTTEQYETVTSALTLCNQMQKSCTRRELRESLRNMLGANDYLNKKKQIQDRMDGR